MEIEKPRFPKEDLQKFMNLIVGFVSNLTVDELKILVLKHPEIMGVTFTTTHDVMGMAANGEATNGDN